MKKKITTQSIPKDAKNPVDKLPEDPRVNRKNSQVIEDMKISAAYKLWKERRFRDVTLNEQLTCNGKRFRSKVIARDKKGRVYAVECATRSAKQKDCKVTGRFAAGQLHNCCFPQNRW